MLTPSTRVCLQNIVHRIGADEAASSQGVDRLLAELDLGDVEPGPSFRPDPEDPGDLGDWFGHAPDWLRRS